MALFRMPRLRVAAGLRRRFLNILILLVMLASATAVRADTTSFRTEWTGTVNVPKGQHFILVQISQSWAYLEPGNECVYVANYGTGDVCADSIHAYLNIPGKTSIIIDLKQSRVHSAATCRLRDQLDRTSPGSVSQYSSIPGSGNVYLSH